MRRWLGLLAFVTACGGASQTEIFGGAVDGGTSGTGPSGTGTDTPPPPGTPPPPPGTHPPPPPPGNPPCTGTTYYKDQDRDGVGGTTTQVTCTSPGDGWVTKGGDCADNNLDVFPGQTDYLDEAYSKSGGVKSFDFDCNGTEEQEAPVQKAASTCVVAGNGCAGGGYIPAQRIGAGVDPLCGATEYQTCTRKTVGLPGPGCEGTIATVPNPVLCH